MIPDKWCDSWWLFLLTFAHFRLRNSSGKIHIIIRTKWHGWVLHVREWHFVDLFVSFKFYRSLCDFRVKKALNRVITVEEETSTIPWIQPRHTKILLRRWRRGTSPRKLKRRKVECRWWTVASPPSRYTELTSVVEYQFRCLIAFQLNGLLPCWD